jgi:hypothetical protein
MRKNLLPISIPVLPFLLTLLQHPHSLINRLFKVSPVTRVIVLDCVSSNKTIAWKYLRDFVKAELELVIIAAGNSR